MLKLISKIIALSLALALQPVNFIVAQDGVADTVEELWLDVSMRPQLVDIYNRKARPNDIARIEHISMIDVLDDITVGRRLLIFKSISDTEQLMPRIGDQIDIIGYNLEHGPSNHPDEQADPVGSVIEMRRIADKYGKELALGPDRSFALSHGVAMAPYVDLFILQVQRVQTDPATVRDFVVPLVRQFRRVNPNIEISVQIRTEGDVMQLRTLISSMLNELDGISVLTSPETVATAQDLLYELRPDAGVAAQAAGAPIAAVEASANSSPAADAGQLAEGRQAPINPLAYPQPFSDESGAPNPEQGAAFIGAVATAGIIGLALTIATVLFILQSLQSR